jgi:hypothetical protein
MSHAALNTFTTRYDMRRNTETILRVFERETATPSLAQQEAR